MKSIMSMNDNFQAQAECLWGFHTNDIPFTKLWRIKLNS